MTKEATDIKKIDQRRHWQIKIWPKKNDNYKNDEKKCWLICQWPKKIWRKNSDEKNDDEKKNDEKCGNRPNYKVFEFFEKNALMKALIK